MRSHVATMVGNFAIRSIAVSTDVSCEPSARCGTKCATADVAVRSTSIGHASRGIACSIAMQAGRQRAARGEARVEVDELLVRREVPEQQQVDDLLVVRMVGQIVDVVAAVGEPADLPFDVGQDGLADDDPFETRIHHGGGHNGPGFSAQRDFSPRARFGARPKGQTRQKS